MNSQSASAPSRPSKVGEQSLLRRFGAVAVILSMTVAAANAQAPSQMPPPAVAVLQVEPRAVPVVRDLPGRIAATRVAEVRARVSGILLERVFQQGTLVRQGDVLYRIDPKLFEVRVASAQAALQKAKAGKANSEQQLARQKTLREREVASGINFENAELALAQADADVGLAEAALAEAKINLDYTQVRAPITGIIGAALVTEGALVTADATQNLALIQQIDPVYADFTQSAQELLALKRSVDAGKLASPEPGKARVELVFDDGATYAQAGSLLFASASVDATTGQVTLRAEFPNAKGDLLPGMYVRVRLEQAVREGAITVPQRAVVRTQEGRAQVYVISPENTAEARDVELGEAIDSNWLVLSGLKAGEKVAVDGVQKLQSGAKLAPEPWSPATDSAGSKSR